MGDKGDECRSTRVGLLVNEEFVSMLSIDELEL
jgi:hypothetical protein